MLGLAPQLHHPWPRSHGHADTAARARCVLGLAPQLHHPAAGPRCPLPRRRSRQTARQAGRRRRQHRRTVSLDTSTERENTKQQTGLTKLLPQSGPGSELQGLACMLGRALLNPSTLIYMPFLNSVDADHVDPNDDCFGRSINICRNTQGTREKDQDTRHAGKQGHLLSSAARHLNIIRQQGSAINKN